MSPLNRNPLVNFELNFWGFFEVWPFNMITVDDSRDLQDAPDFWSHLVVAGYQPDPDEDGDPNAELAASAKLGTTNKSRGISVIFLETIRDSKQMTPSRFGPWLYGVVAHEIGHAPGGQSEAQDHNEGGLQNGSDIERDDFTDPTIRRFREADKWHKAEM